MYISFPKKSGDSGSRGPASAKVTAWALIITGFIFLDASPVVGVIAIVLGLGVAFRSADSSKPPLPFTREWQDEDIEYEEWKRTNDRPAATKADFREVRRREQLVSDEE